MKRTIIFAAILALGAQSFAQQNPLMPVNMNIRGGFVYPLEDATRNFTGNMFGIGLDFNTNVSLVKGGMGYLSLDYAAKSIGGNKNTFVSVMYNQRFPLGYNKTTETSTYYFAGVGISFIDVTTSKSVLGVRGGVGADLSTNIFAEMTLTFSGNANGAKANTVGVFVGYKF